MQEIKATLDNHPEQAPLMAELDDRNRQAHHELEVYEQTGIFPAIHPIAVQFLADKKSRQLLEKLKRENPEAFLKQVANITQNIRRIQSRIKKHHYRDEEELEKWQRNLDNAQRLMQIIKQVV